MLPRGNISMEHCNPGNLVEDRHARLADLRLHTIESLKKRPALLYANVPKHHKMGQNLTGTWRSFIMINRTMGDEWGRVPAARRCRRAHIRQASLRH